MSAGIAQPHRAQGLRFRFFSAQPPLPRFLHHARPPLPAPPTMRSQSRDWDSWTPMERAALTGSPSYACGGGEGVERAGGEGGALVGRDHAVPRITCSLSSRPPLPPLSTPSPRPPLPPVTHQVAALAPLPPPLQPATHQVAPLFVEGVPGLMHRTCTHVIWFEWVCVCVEGKEGVEGKELTKSGIREGPPALSTHPSSPPAGHPA